MYSLEVDSLIAGIESAFKGVRRREITLHEADVIDTYGRLQSVHVPDWRPAVRGT